MAFNRSHNRYNRHNRFKLVRYRRQLKSFLTVQGARLTAGGKTLTVKSTLAGIAASGVLTTDATAPANASTVTIGTKVYTWQTVLTNVDGNVLIGATVATAYANLAAAINLGAGSGTTYAAATTANPAGTSAVATATTVTVTATTPGSAGNAIASTQAGTSHSTWGGATFAGGVDSSLGLGSKFTVTAHGYHEQEGPFLVTNSGGALPAGLVATQLVWAHVDDANTIRLAPGVTSETVEEAAEADTPTTFLSVTTIGTGTQTISRALTQEGVFDLLRVNKPEAILAATSSLTLK